MIYRNFKFIIVLMLFFNTVKDSQGQSQEIDCLHYYTRIDSLSKDKLVLWATDSPIEIVGGRDRITELLVYPKSALQNQIEGRVFVRFVIDDRGQMHCLQLISGIREDFNKEALRVVKLLKFRPAIRDGKPVTSSMFLPLVFRLEREKRKNKR
jgi:TonB family protein